MDCPWSGFGLRIRLLAVRHRWAAVVAFLFCIGVGPALAISTARTPMHVQALAVNGVVGMDVVRVDLGAGKAGPIIRLPITPTGVVVSSDGRRAYAFGIGSAEVVPIDLRTGRAETPIRLPAPADDVALSPDDRRLYVTAGSHTFLIVNVQTDRVVTVMSIPGGVGSIVISRDGKAAYVDATAFTVEKCTAVFAGGDDITTIHLARESIGQVFKLPDTAIVLGVSNDDRTLYAAQDPTCGSSGPVFYRINVTGGAIGKGKPLPYAQGGLAMAPSGRTAYIETDERHLAALDLHTLTIGHPFEVGQDPAQAIVTTDGRYIAVATFQGIVVVDLRANHAYPPIKLPSPSNSLIGRADHGAIGLAAIPTR